MCKNWHKKLQSNRFMHISFFYILSHHDQKHDNILFEFYMKDQKKVVYNFKII